MEETKMIIDKESVIDLYKADILYKIHKTSEEIRLFKKKYEKDFNEFKKEIEGSKENFEKWDDYLEWEAAIKEYEYLKKKLEELEFGNFKVS